MLSIKKKQPPITALSVEQLDRFAWETICNWPKYSDIKINYYGLDFSDLTRWFLWDKVGRAIRRKIDPDGFSFEADFFKCRNNRSVKSGAIRLQSGNTKLSRQIKRTILPFYHQVRNTFYDLKFHISLIRKSHIKQAPILYSPIPSSRLETAIESFIKSGTANIFSPPTKLSGYKGSCHVGNLIKIWKPDLEFAANLHSGILKGLKAQGVELLPFDSYFLKEQIVKQSGRIKAVESELCSLRPNAVLVHGDNHPPHQEYVLVALRENIPSIMLEHGLDCERYYLDEAYASAIAVWGETRTRRYQRHSQWQPEFLQTTVNPEYYNIILPEKLNDTGGYWLWVTRPHSPEKCYAPSRRPEEGLEILNEILLIMRKNTKARLIIKPHPFDYADIYEAKIKSSKVFDRVEIVNLNIRDLLRGAKVVISEDSTAGMESMLWGKILVHVHFSKSAPVMPFVDYGAALPGFSPEVLEESILKAELLTNSEKKDMLEGQRRFLLDNAGRCDGLSGERVVSFVKDIIHV